MKDLLLIETLPQIPLNWNYEESVAKVKQLIYRWKNLTIELATELWIARDKLSGGKPGPKIRDNCPELPTWEQYCQDIGCEKRTINRWLKRFFPTRIADAAELPQGQFAIIYADPPWEYDFSKSHSRAIPTHYPVMTLDQICALPIPTNEDAILFLWATNPKIREALTVIDAWGFEYRTNMVWVKDKWGMGYYVRGQHELILIARKGKLPPPDEANRVSSVLMAPRRDHSRKPEQVYDIIERMYPSQAYIELFARKSHPGWIAWGNEIEK